MFVKAANFLLSRLPWFRERYSQWSPTKRIIIAFFLYLIVLPVIPIAIAIVMYIHDPEGFKKSKALPILGAIIVAQLSAFGLIAVQTPTPETPASSNSVDAGTVTPASANEAKDTSKTTSQPSDGREFKNCDEAAKAGVYNIAKSDASYRAELDRDRDGVACER
jgi:Excalibur calcium-binding domain